MLAAEQRFKKKRASTIRRRICSTTLKWKLGISSLINALKIFAPKARQQLIGCKVTALICARPFGRRRLPILRRNIFFIIQIILLSRIMRLRPHPLRAVTAAMFRLSKAEKQQILVAHSFSRSGLKPKKKVLRSWTIPRHGN